MVELPAATQTPTTAGARTHRASAAGRADAGLRAHWRACSAPATLRSRARQALEALHGLSAPRLVSTWLVLTLLAVLAAMAF
jgi:hypothetical protein